jgi:hypothetical protein
MGCLRLSCHRMQLVRKATAAGGGTNCCLISSGLPLTAMPGLNHHHRLQLVKPVLQGTCMHSAVTAHACCMHAAHVSSTIQWGLPYGLAGWSTQSASLWVKSWPVITLDVIVLDVGRSSCTVVYQQRAAVHACSLQQCCDDRSLVYVNSSAFKCRCWSIAAPECSRLGCAWLATSE